MEEQPFDQEELDLSTSIDMQMGEFRTKNGKLYAVSHDDHNGKGNPEVKYVRFRHHGSQDHEYFLDWHQKSQGHSKNNHVATIAMDSCKIARVTSYY